MTLVRLRPRRNAWGADQRGRQSDSPNDRSGTDALAGRVKANDGQHGFGLVKRRIVLGFERQFPSGRPLQRLTIPRTEPSGGGQLAESRGGEEGKGRV